MNNFVNMLVWECFCTPMDTFLRNATTSVRYSSLLCSKAAFSRVLVAGSFRCNVLLAMFANKSEKKSAASEILQALKNLAPSTISPLPAAWSSAHGLEKLSSSAAVDKGQPLANEGEA